MKTTEEKAKAYDEALKRAIAAHKDEDRHLKATLERIFPELKESEDEKIRKVLKHYLEVRRCQTQSDEEYINCNNFLAWLEKQGTSYTKRDIDDAYIKGMSDAKRELEKQKPTEWKQENREELTEFENAMMHIGGSFFGENAGLDPNDTNTIKEQAELLLELAPKTEWSEEDEARLQSCLNILQVQAKGFMGITETINTKWLKSLKERYTWKPSKEQMDAMQMAVSYFGYSWTSKEQKLLESLYKDLKKLTEG